MNILVLICILKIASCTSQTTFVSSQKGYDDDTCGIFSHPCETVEYAQNKRMQNFDTLHILDLDRSIKKVVLSKSITITSQSGITLGTSFEIDSEGNYRALNFVNITFENHNGKQIYVKNREKILEDFILNVTLENFSIKSSKYEENSPGVYFVGSSVNVILKNIVIKDVHFDHGVFFVYSNFSTNLSVENFSITGLMDSQYVLEAISEFLVNVKIKNIIFSNCDIDSDHNVVLIVVKQTKMECSSTVTRDIEESVIHIENLTFENSVVDLGYFDSVVNIVGIERVSVFGITIVDTNILSSLGVIGIGGCKNTRNMLEIRDLYVDRSDLKLSHHLNGPCVVNSFCNEGKIMIKNTKVKVSKEMNCVIFIDADDPVEIYKKNELYMTIEEFVILGKNNVEPLHHAITVKNIKQLDIVDLKFQGKDTIDESYYGGVLVVNSDVSLSHILSENNFNTPFDFFDCSVVTLANITIQNNFVYNGKALISMEGVKKVVGSELNMIGNILSNKQIIENYDSFFVVKYSYSKVLILFEKLNFQYNTVLSQSPIDKSMGTVLSIFCLRTNTFPQLFLNETIYFRESSFIGNQGDNVCGTLYFDGIGFSKEGIFQNTIFRYNFVYNGGCICVKNVVNKYSKLHLEDITKWSENTANIAGGNIFSDKFIALYSNDKLLDGRASYGKNIATYPSEIHKIFLERIEKNKTEEITSDETVYIYPGEEINIRVQFLDNRYQDIVGKVTEYQTLLNISETHKIHFDGDNPVSIKDVLDDYSGMYVFSGKFTGETHRSFVVEFFSNIPFFKNKQVFFTFNTTLCPPYYYYHKENSEKESRCVECFKEFYKIVEGNFECQPCPKIGAECEDGNIEAEEGYWLLHTKDDRDIISLICLGESCGPESCEGEGRNFSLPLCEACEEGFYKIDEECIKYEYNAKNVVGVVFVSIGLYLLFIVLVSFFANSLTLSSYTKSYIFFIQTVMLIRKSEFNVYYEKLGFQLWFHEVLEWFHKILNFVFESGFIEVGLKGFEALNSFPFRFTPYLNLFTKTFVMFGSFLMFFAFLLLVKLFLCCKRQIKTGGKLNPSKNMSINIEKDSMDRYLKKIGEYEKHHDHSIHSINDGTVGKNKRKLVVKCLIFFRDRFGFTEKGLIHTVIYLYDVMYEILLDKSLVFFTCKDFGMFGRRMLEFTDVTCFTGEWFAWCAWYFLVFLFLLISPIIILIFLLINKKQMHNHEFEQKWGELYEEYRYWWWFVFQTAKKFLVVFVQWICTTFVGESNFEVSYIVLSLIVGVYIFIQLQFKPFKKWYQNFIEFLSMFMLFAITLLRTGALKSDSFHIYLWIYLLYVTSMFFFAFHAVFGGLIENIKFQNFLKRLSKHFLNVFKKKKEDGNNQNLGKSEKKKIITIVDEEKTVLIEK